MLLVIGATGATGQELVRQARVRAIEVRALVRARTGGREEADLPAWVQVVTGDIRDAAAVARALEGVDAVVSLLGARRGDPVGTVRSDGTALLVRSMEAAGVSRLVSVSSIGVGSSIDAMSRMARTLWPRIVGAERLAEAERAEAAVMASSLAWTIVRPPRLVDGPPAADVRAATELPVGMRSQITRTDLAALLLDLASGDQFTRQAVAIDTVRTGRSERTPSALPG